MLIAITLLGLFIAFILLSALGACWQELMALKKRVDSLEASWRLVSTPLVSHGVDSAKYAMGPYQ